MFKSKFFVLVLSSVLFLAPYVCFSKDLTQEEMLNAGGRSIEATITWAGTYNFFASNEGGEPEEYLIENGETKFIPSESRLSVGDVVKIIYFAGENGSSSKLRNNARYIEIIKQSPKKFPIVEFIDGIISIQAKSSNYFVYLPAYEKLILVESFSNKLPMDCFASVGQKISIRLKLVPQNPGGGYAYLPSEIKCGSNPSPIKAPIKMRNMME